MTLCGHTPSLLNLHFQKYVAPAASSAQCSARDIYLLAVCSLLYLAGVFHAAMQSGVEEFSDLEDAPASRATGRSRRHFKRPAVGGHRLSEKTSLTKLKIQKKKRAALLAERRRDTAGLVHTEMLANGLLPDGLYIEK